MIFVFPFIANGGFPQKKLLALEIASLGQEPRLAMTAILMESLNISTSKP